VPRSEERPGVTSGVLDHEEVDPFDAAVAPALAGEITVLGSQPPQGVVGAVVHFSYDQRDSVFHALSFNVGPPAGLAGSGVREVERAL